MNVPEYVRVYYDARWWEFLHIGIPATLVAVILFAVARWKGEDDDS